MEINKFNPIVSPFFGETGLTATSADHIANIAKHSYEAILEQLENINFVKSSVQIIGSDVKMETSTWNNDANVDSIKAKLQYIAECKGFIAFLREAIALKQKLTEEIESYQSDSVRNFQYPKAPVSLTPEDVLNTFSVGDREKYLTLDAIAATIGKYIHPRGQFYEARKKAFNANARKTDVIYNGRDTIVTTFETIDPNKIDETLSELQKWHRSVEAELNGIKNNIENIIRDDYAKKMDEYKVECAKCDSERMKLLAIDNETKLNRAKEVKELKIVIPNRYRALYEHLSKD